MTPMGLTAPTSGIRPACAPWSNPAKDHHALALQLARQSSRAPGHPDSAHVAFTHAPPTSSSPHDADVAARWRGRGSHPGDTRFDGVIDVARPSQTPDNGLGATIEDWDACAQSMQCRALCGEVAPHSFKPFGVSTCDLIADAGTAGDQTLHLHVIAMYDDCASGI